MNKIDDKIKKLLEYDLHPTLRGGWKITEEMRALIHEIAEECNKLDITRKASEDIPEWIEQATPEEVYIHMLQRIVSAPTRMHMLCVPRILLPIIDEKINNKNERFPHIVGQEAEIYFNGEWKRGKIVNGYRFRDGVVTIETQDGERIWCSEEGTHLYRPAKVTERRNGNG